jgi:hypothetical protein
MESILARLLLQCNMKITMAGLAPKNFTKYVYKQLVR